MQLDQIKEPGILLIPYPWIAHVPTIDLAITSQKGSL